MKKKNLIDNLMYLKAEYEEWGGCKQREITHCGYSKGMRKTAL